MRIGARTAAAVTIAVAAGAWSCSSPAADISNAPTAGGRPTAVIPLPQQSDGSAVTPPSLPRGEEMPPNTVPLMELYRQGAADILR